MVAAAKGYRMLVVMPEHMTGERIKIMAVDSNRKQVHNDCAACGDEYCTFEEMSTTEKERSNFIDESVEWRNVDPRLVRGTRRA
jgi:cysteine synthase